MGYARQYVVGLCASVGALCIGFALGWSAPMQLPISEGRAYNFKASGTEFGWVASAMVLGAACSCFPLGILSQKFGRKMLMLCLIIPLLLGLTLITAATELFMLILGRFLVGASVGPYCVLVPVYNTEIAQIEKRGFMGLTYQLMLVWGILFSYVLGSYMTVLSFNIIANVIPVLYFILLLWLPESPVFYVQKGNLEKAKQVLLCLRGKDADVTSDLNQMAADANKVTGPIREGMKRRGTIHGLIISTMLFFFQQFTGINAIAFYAAKIFESAGTGISSELCTIIVGMMGCIAIVPAILFIDKGGRRIFLLIGAVVMCIMTVIMGIYFMCLVHSNVGWLPITAICVYVLAFSMSLGPIPWLMNAELFAEDVKSICNGIGGTICWIFAFLVTILFPISVEHIGEGWTFFGFAVVCLICAICVFFIVPETKGRTLSNIQEQLHTKKN